jgi:hypothetical protein
LQHETLQAAGIAGFGGCGSRFSATSLEQTCRDSLVRHKKQLPDASGAHISMLYAAMLSLPIGYSYISPLRAGVSESSDTEIYYSVSISWKKVIGARFMRGVFNS